MKENVFVTDAYMSMESQLRSEKQLFKNLDAALDRYSNWHHGKLEVLKSKFYHIETTLKSLGFEIDKLRCGTNHFTHMYASSTYLDLDIKWFEEKKMRFYCELKMVGRRKPITKGSDEYLDKAANKIEDYFSEATFIPCNLNKYSLNKSEGVLFEFYI